MASHSATNRTAKIFWSTKSPIPFGSAPAAYQFGSDDPERIRVGIDELCRAVHGVRDSSSGDSCCDRRRCGFAGGSSLSKLDKFDELLHLPSNPFPMAAVDSDEYRTDLCSIGLFWFLFLDSEN
ncbi:hypothetical protein ACB092_01G186700 [Castanea dentata]